MLQLKKKKNKKPISPQRTTATIGKEDFLLQLLGKGCKHFFFYASKRIHKDIFCIFAFFPLEFPPIHGPVVAAKSCLKVNTAMNM